MVQRLYLYLKKQTVSELRDRGLSGQRENGSLSQVGYPIQQLNTRVLLVDSYLPAFRLGLSWPVLACLGFMRAKELDGINAQNWWNYFTI